MGNREEIDFIWDEVGECCLGLCQRWKGKVMCAIALETGVVLDRGG